jgi:hypothetical protein
MGHRELHILNGEGEFNSYRWEVSWNGSGTYVLRPGSLSLLADAGSTNLLFQHLTVGSPGGPVTGTTTVNVAVSPGFSPLVLQLSDHWQTGSSYQVVKSAQSGEAVRWSEVAGKAIFWESAHFGLWLAALGWFVIFRR